MLNSMFNFLKDVCKYDLTWIDENQSFREDISYDEPDELAQGVTSQPDNAPDLTVIPDELVQGATSQPDNAPDLTVIPDELAQGVTSQPDNAPDLTIILVEQHEDFVYRTPL